MKTTSLLFSLLLGLSLSAQMYSDLSFETRHKNVYAEFGGSSIGVGANFDMRLQKGVMDGIGFRAGIGGISLDARDGDNEAEMNITTFPIEFNHVAGKKRSSFISGVGILPAYAKISGQGDFSDNEYVSEDGFGIAGGFLNLGYRLQPKKTGFMMQFNWNPVLLREAGFQAGWFGLGIGIGFK